MTHLSAQAASPGIPEFPMSDVIDSLKRLERVGSETSKTNLKLVQSAKELEALIVAHVPPGIRFSRAGSATTPRRSPYAFNYVVNDKRLMSISAAGNRSVSTDRQSAIRFSEDIADGLLEVIVSALAKNLAESQPALRILSEATTVLSAKVNQQVD
jgi:hypothetical protein